MRDLKMLLSVADACHSHAVENNMAEMLPKLEALRQSLMEETGIDFSFTSVPRQAGEEQH